MPLVLADIAPELIAALALVAVLAVYFAVEALQGIARAIGVPNWPLVGGFLYGGISHIVTWVGNSLAWLWQHANPINMFLATTGWLMHEINGVIETVIYDAYSTFHRITTSSIPGAINAAEALSRTLYTDAVAEANAAVGALRSVVAGDYTAAINWANAVGHSLVGQLEADVTFLEGYINTRVAAAEAAAVGLEQSLQGWALTELGQLRTFVAGELEQAIAGLRSDIGSAVNGLERTLSPEIAAAAAVGAAAAAEFARWKADCGDPLCSNLSGFGNIIGAIEGLLTDVAVVAFLAEIVADPQGAVDTIEGIGNDIVQPVWTVLSDAIGLARAA